MVDRKTKANVCDFHKVSNRKVAYSEQPKRYMQTENSRFI